MLNAVYVLGYRLLEEIGSTNTSPVMDSHREVCTFHKSKRKKTKQKMHCSIALISSFCVSNYDSFFHLLDYFFLIAMP